MELKIRKINNGKILASFSKEELEISEHSESWTIEGINKFLIKLASSSPEEISIVYDELEYQNDEIYKHVVDLFKVFQDEFNKKIKEEREEIKQ